MKRLLISSPAYGSIDPRAAQSIRVAMMSVPDVKWIGDVSQFHQLIAAARNNAVHAALTSDADGIVWIDDDILLPPEGIRRLVEQEKDFISGVYFQRAAPYWPLVMFRQKKSGKFRWLTKFPRESLVPVDAFGFGICYTSLHMLRTMYEKLSDVKANGWFVFDHLSKFCPYCRKEIPKGFGEDVHFCVQAVASGFQPYVDTSVLCKHLGLQEEVGLEHFERWKAETNFQAVPYKETGE